MSRPVVSERAPASRHPVECQSLLATQDVIALVYYATLTFLLAVAPHSAARGQSLVRVLACVAILLMAIFVKRALTSLPAWLRVNSYRAVLAGLVVESYLMLRDLLPAVRSDAVDAELYALDLQLFGVEPALWLERFNQPAVVEWFAFFYFSYFGICAAYLFGMLWFARPGRQTSEFAVGSLLVLFVGQLGYLAVPGYGPVAHLSQAFAGPIQGGFFWGCVQDAVAGGGAMKDIFPSLHTALPTWFAAFAWRRARYRRRWLPIAAVTTFFAANIVVSTMFLRWHYAVDVVAGLALAGFAAFAAPRLVDWEQRLRRARAWAPTWR